METGSQILSVQPNTLLGLGANAGIPAIDPKQNLDTINNTARDIQLLNHANNIKLYEQKIKDRDNTLQLLASGEISSGEIDPNDRKYYDKAKEETKNAFYDMVQNGGLNNPKAVKNYYDKVADLANVSVHAQSRYLELKKLEQEKTNQVLPEDISMYDNHIKDEYKKDFWQPINPLQKAFHLNLPSMTSSIAGAAQTEGTIGGLDENGMPSNTTQWNTTTDKNGVVTNRTTTKTAPLKSAQLTRAATAKATGGINVNPNGSLSEISYTPEKYWDYPTMLKNAQEQYISDPTQRENQNQWLQQVTNYDDAQKVKLLQAYNNRIAQYSTERGIQPDKLNADGSPHFPDQINYVADPSGRIQISETPSSFAAKHTLASIDGNYVEKPQPVFNKDIAGYKIQKERADSDLFYKRAMAGAANIKARAYVDNLHQQMKLRKDAVDQDKFLDEIYTRNILQQPSLVEAKGNNTVGLANIKADNSLPVFTLDGKTPKQLIPIGGKPVYSPQNYKDDGQGGKTLKVGAVPLYYEGGHYEPQYLLNGNVLQPQQIADLYTTFAANKGKAWKGGIDDFIKGYLQNNIFQYKLKGANGSTDRDLSNAAQRIISNQATKKGQTAVFDNTEQPPMDEQIPNDNNQ